MSMIEKALVSQVVVWRPTYAELNVVAPRLIPHPALQESTRKNPFDRLSSPAFSVSIDQRYAFRKAIDRFSASFSVSLASSLEGLSIWILGRPQMPDPGCYGMHVSLDGSKRSECQPAWYSKEAYWTGEKAKFAADLGRTFKSRGSLTENIMAPGQQGMGMGRYCLHTYDLKFHLPSQLHDRPLG